jgi:2-C-methyl-D-erythritol 2,4-cyclodiphosphate synthase
MVSHRIGFGTDIHRLEEPGPLLIGGLTIPHDRHAVGHSDADTLLHAITDAILGAAGLGDIGQLFPDTDPANRGRASDDMLRRAWSLASEQGWRLANLDCTIHAQKPKLAPHIPEMKKRVASILGVSPEKVNIKAKTGEGVDAVGREEAIAAQAVVLLWRATDQD